MKKWLLLFLISVFFVGCVPNRNTDITPTNPFISASPTGGITPLTATTTFTETAVPTNSPTATIIPTSIEPEIAFTLTPFPPDIRIKKLLQNPPCEFPCLWNIKVGATPWNDALALLQFLDIKLNSEDVQSYTHLSGVLIHGPYFDQATIDIYERNSVVEFIAMAVLSDYLGNDSPYTMKNILQQLGNPSQILTYTSSSGQALPSFGIELFYKDLGLLVFYDGQAQNITSSDILLCTNFSSKNVSGMRIYTQAPQLSSPIEEFPDEGLQVEQKIISPLLQSISEGTGLTISDFRDQFLKDENSCFTVKR